MENLTLRDYFAKQLNEAIPVSESKLNMLKNKTYFNGEPLEVRDIPLVAVQQDSTVTSPDSTVEDISLNLIWINERHIDLFELDDRYDNNLENNMPFLKLKE